MSFTAESRDRTRPTLPMAPMVDLLFLLLIFFMTASVFRDQATEIPVSLAGAATGITATAAATQITVTVTDDERIYLGQLELTLPELRSKLAELWQLYPNEQLAIRGDQGSRHGLIIQVMDAAREAGFEDLTFPVVLPAEEQP